MVLSHLFYCIAVVATDSATRLLSSLYKQALKILDQKPQKMAPLLNNLKYTLFTFSNFIKFLFLKVVFKCLNEQAPQVMSQIFKNIDNSSTMTRSRTKQNCQIPWFRTMFGQSSLSVQSTYLWNSLPSEIKSQTELKRFSMKVKHWLKQQQKCEH